MSKVLIDRALLERTVYSLELAYETDTPTVRDICAVLAAPSGTPAMPVKAYYHEAPNEYGGLNKSVGLEVRKEFTDAPLVLESDAMARIACLEGEIAKRDARIVELESQYQRDVCGLNNEGDPIGGDPAGGYANDNARLRAELSALKAQEPVAWAGVIEDCASLLMVEPQNWKATPLYAAPVSEAKAQGVVMPEPLMAAITRADDVLHALSNWESSSVKLEQRHGSEWAKEVDAIRRELHTQLARLNATPVHQVSVPDEMRSLAQRLREYNQNPHHINPMSEAFHILVADAANALSTACVPKEIAAAITWSEHLLFECGALTSTRAPSVHVYNKTFAAVNEARAMIAAAPAAPAADAWLVEALDYQVLFDAIASATSVYANGAINISVQAFRDALAAHSAEGVV